MLWTSLALALWMSSPSDGCLSELRSLGAEFAVGPARPGLTPVLLTVPLNGVHTGLPGRINLDFYQTF